MRELPKYDADVVREKTLNYIADMRLKAQIHAVVCEVLKTFDGKVINKRMATAVEVALVGKGLSNLSVHWKTDFSWNSIKVWGTQTLPYTGGYDLMVNDHSDHGPKEDGRFDYEHWRVRYGSAYGNDKCAERANESEAGLRTLKQRVAAYNDAVDAVAHAKTQLQGLATWS